MSDVAIRVENLGKMYRIQRNVGSHRYRTLREDVNNLIKRSFTSNADKPSHEDVWALRDVSFEIKHGTVVGIIGHNGAGKSTLLKILSRITSPSTGYADIYGRVGSLLEVGTGFHPELTGRENIFLNGAILGMSRAEIQAKFDEIVAFSGVEQYLDEPVKRYSSGMYTRLAFSVAAHLEPEILIVDEVLSVGDAEFQKKSLGKMGEVADSGRTVLFVSHNLSAIESLCSKCIWLAHGTIENQGEPSEMAQLYSRTEDAKSEWKQALDGSRVSNPYFKPLRLAIVDKNLDVICRELRADEEIGIMITGWVEKQNIALTVGYALSSSSGSDLFKSVHTDTEQDDWPEISIGHNTLLTWIPPHFLNEGNYKVELLMTLHYQEWLSQPHHNAPTVQFSIRGGLSKSPYWLLKRPGALAPLLSFERIHTE